jgi:hypothetical protein
MCECPAISALRVFIGTADHPLQTHPITISAARELVKEFDMLRGVAGAVANGPTFREATSWVARESSSFKLGVST